MPLNPPVCKYKLCLTRFLKQDALIEYLQQRRVQMESFMEAEKWIQFILKFPFRPIHMKQRQLGETHASPLHWLVQLVSVSGRFTELGGSP